METLEHHRHYSGEGYLVALLYSSLHPFKKLGTYPEILAMIVNGPVPVPHSDTTSRSLDHPGHVWQTVVHFAP